ncbi:hypothetical protein K0U07_05715 [bacterium]|nr:hypothetical protein [bacterium]
MKSTSKYSIKNPFSAKITKIAPLNKEGSSKSNHHVEFSLEGSEIEYEVGCSFGLLPNNCKEEVERILLLLPVSKDTLVKPKKVGTDTTVEAFFLEHVNLHRVTKKMVNALLPFQTDDRLKELLEGEWKEYTEKHDLVEFLENFYKSDLSIHSLVDLMSPMLPRFYSVASSQNVVGDHLHLLVADFCYTKGVKKHKSITTKHLLDKKTIRLFHQPNPSFQPPKEDTPVIMIGPGTGLAAFRGFLQERIIHHGCKNNLLFTGDRNKEFDFYYEEELTNFAAEGKLELFTAFSRDGAEKVYVQNRIFEQRAKIFDLLENQNGQVFISGDAHKMAKDVVATFEKIFEEFLHISHQEAHAHVKALIKQKRFHLDVY